MALYTTIHLHNVPVGREQEYAQLFEGRHAEHVASLGGFRGASRFEVTSEQIMADIPQPWRYLSIYDFETTSPAIDLQALASMLAKIRDAGLVATDTTERIHTYKLISDWKTSANWRAADPFSGVSIILGNYVAGRYREYHEWYENVHSDEVTNVPGHVAMRRGELSEVQIEPRHYCPGDQLVMTAQQTDNLAFTIKDFGLRAAGLSPSGIAMAPRSAAGSIARTVHYFRKISGDRFWADGIAYAGDLSVYPEDF